MKRKGTGEPVPEVVESRVNEKVTSEDRGDARRRARGRHCG